MSTTIAATDSRLQTSLAFLLDLFAGAAPRDFAIRCWDGTLVPPEPGQPARFTLVLTHPGSVRAMFWPPKISALGEAFVFGDFDVEGDMAPFCDFLDRLETYFESSSILQKLKLGWRLWRLPAEVRTREGRPASHMTGTLHSRERDRQAVSFHYDQSNEFFQSFLGPKMVYTCSIFDNVDDPLEAAETRQLDTICRKLRLKPGERLLDIGCGWGALAMHAAQHYGAEAVGVTLSERQAELARSRVRAAGLDGRCRIDLADYRDIDENQAFDKIATIEVMDHFGAAQFSTYFKKCWRLLRPQGSMLLQQISLNDPALLRPSIRAQIQAFIFPDGELVPINYALAEAEKAGFEVRDLECLREHYVLTLSRWLRNLESHRDEAVAALDEAAFRNFRMYLAGARRLFQHSQQGVHHLLLAKSYPSASGYPLSRHDWYRD